MAWQVTPTSHVHSSARRYKRALGAKLSKGDPHMDDWINEEVERIKGKEKDQAALVEREQLIANQGSRYWSDLVHLIKEALTKINANPDIHQKLGENLIVRDENISSFRIIKSAYPAVYLTATNLRSYVKLERKIVTNGQDRTTKDERENLEFDLDANGRAFLRTEKGEVLNIQEAVKHILKPLLNY
jgi:hypothetical protein